MIDDMMDNMSDNIHILLRVLILISTIVLIYFVTEDRFRQNIPTTIVIIAVLIFIERCVSSYKCTNHEQDENLVEGFDRTSRLEWLNANRGKLGQFYVACRGCGRKKILQERVKSLFDQPPCGRYQTVGSCEGCSSCDNYEGCNGCDGCSNPHSDSHSDYCVTCRGSGLSNGRKCKECGGCGGCGKCQRCSRRQRYRVRRFYKSNRESDSENIKIHHGTDIGCTKCNSGNSDRGVHTSYCIKDCADNVGRDTVSLWNNNYIDTNEIFCYNCGLDRRAKIENAALNYRELPAINGPPGYSVYRDAAYNY